MDFFSVFLFDHGCIIGENRYYFGACFLNNRRLEIGYPRGNHARQTGEKLEAVPQAASQRPFKVKRSTHNKRKSQKEKVKAVA